MPTLLQADSLFPDLKLKDICQKQIAYFKDCLESQELYFFDAAQILLGLLALKNHLYDDRLAFLVDAYYRKCLDMIDDNGIVHKNNYVKDYMPSYYSRAAWPLVLYGTEVNQAQNPKVLSLLDNLAAMAQDNYSFKNWSFDGRDNALTHTIVYTSRGLYECGKLLNNSNYIDISLNSCQALLNSIDKDGSIAGSYETNWKGDHSYICAAGNAQLVVLLLELYKENKQDKYLNPIAALLKPLVNKAVYLSSSAVPSSIPVWAKYQRFRYTNWTQKFYSDALLPLLNSEGLKE